MNGELWLEYRRTWEEFSRRLSEMQELADSGQNAQASAALSEVKKARLEHNAARDRLAKHLAARKIAAEIATTEAPTQENLNAGEKERRIRKTARLIWEFSGKPQNTAEADWRHAEELVRASSA